MNKKQLYEQIMSTVSKQVKKALFESAVKQYSNYHEAELDAIHFDSIPDTLKSDEPNEEHIFAENMSRQELIEFIGNIDWKLLYEQYAHFYPKASSYYEEYIYDTNVLMSGGTIYVYVPCTDIELEIDVDFDWTYIPYNRGDYYQPPEGGYGELDDYTITDVVVIVGNNRIKLTKDEIKKYGIIYWFDSEFHDIAESIYDEDHFRYDNSDEYDRRKDERDYDY